MSALLMKILWATVEKLLVPHLFQEVLAAGLDRASKSTKTKADDEILEPIIEVLRR